MCVAFIANSIEPTKGPRMRPSDANDWLTPSTSPCRSASALFEMSADTEGFTKAKPATAKAAAA